MEALGRAAPGFPGVGLALGAVLAGVERVRGGVSPPLLAAPGTVPAWKALTGGPHRDGPADCLDGLAGRDAEQRLRIMRDTRLGVFGAVGLVLFLLLETAAVAGLPPSARTRALLVLPALGRATPALLARCFRPARADGHGAAFRDGLGAGAALLALALAAALALAVLGGVSGPLVAAMSAPPAFAPAFFMPARPRRGAGARLAAAPRGARPRVLVSRGRERGRPRGAGVAGVRGDRPCPRGRGRRDRRPRRDQPRARLRRARAAARATPGARPGLRRAHGPGARRRALGAPPAQRARGAIIRGRMRSACDGPES